MPHPSRFYLSRTLIPRTTSSYLPDFDAWGNLACLLGLAPNAIVSRRRFLSTTARTAVALTAGSFTIIEGAQAKTATSPTGEVPSAWFFYTVTGKARLQKFSDAVFLRFEST